MLKQISVGSTSFQIDFPDRCPICHHYGDTEFVHGFFLPRGGGLEVVFRCPFPDCRRTYIGSYSENDYVMLRLAPMKPESSTFAESVAELSPNFVEIFAEAEEARTLGLLQIAGPGYRKAFEFLIKDYAKSVAPDRASEIEAAFSGNIVNDYIPDPRIQETAKRALWLGNDESHYLRKWQSHDLDDLITLIKLTIHWIEIERLSAQYKQEMPNGA